MLSITLLLFPALVKSIEYTLLKTVSLSLTAVTSYIKDAVPRDVLKLSKAFTISREPNLSSSLDSLNLKLF